MGREQSFVGSQSLPLTLHLGLHPLQNIESNAVGDLRRGVLPKTTEDSKSPVFIVVLAEHQLAFIQIVIQQIRP